MRTLLVIFVGLIALVIGGLGIADLLNDKPQPTVIREVVEKKEEYVAVWMTTKVYERGDEVSLQGLSKQQLPLNEALGLGVREDTDIEFSASVLINRRLDIGEVVLPDYLVSPEQPGYIDLLVTEGMTPYPLKVSSRNLINDYIRPGSFIDILTVSSPNENLAENIDNPEGFKGVKASMLLKRIKVLNVGSNDDDNEKSYVSAQAPSEEDGMITVVIEVDPNELANLALAQRTMHIEIYRSQTYTLSESAEVRDVIDNYTGIEELRGNVYNPSEAL
ncbi:Flp pilus assembly protein CpaB [Vibrio caribbeanicus]|uniref:Flp pilus assembly protein CpaB n=1 Tax=Vibrio caribbeanicus TaxID=701175 RepID=UPI0030D6F90D